MNDDASDRLADESGPHSVGGLFGLTAAIVVLFVVARTWIQHAAVAPVDDRYAQYMDELAAHSRAAAQYLNRYHLRYSRSTVATIHFESVCGAVTVLAEGDGFDPSTISPELAIECRSFTLQPTHGVVPDL